MTEARYSQLVEWAYLDHPRRYGHPSRCACPTCVPPLVALRAQAARQALMAEWIGRTPPEWMK